MEFWKQLSHTLKNLLANANWSHIRGSLKDNDPVDTARTFSKVGIYYESKDHRSYRKSHFKDNSKPFKIMEIYI